MDMGAELGDDMSMPAMSSGLLDGDADGMGCAGMLWAQTGTANSRTAA